MCQGKKRNQKFIWRDELRTVRLNCQQYQNAPLFSFSYAGYCPQAKFWHYGDTFGNTTAKCFQDRRIAKLNSSKATQPGTYGDGRPEFPTVYSNTPNLVLAARTRTRERWRNAKKYSLFNEHERGREVKEFDQVFTSDNLSACRVSVAL